jgi:hypothetical protein
MNASFISKVMNTPEHNDQHDPFLDSLGPVLSCIVILLVMYTISGLIFFL